MIPSDESLSLHVYVQHITSSLFHTLVIFDPTSPLRCSFNFEYFFLSPFLVMRVLRATKCLLVNLSQLIFVRRNSTNVIILMVLVWI